MNCKKTEKKKQFNNIRKTIREQNKIFNKKDRSNKKEPNRKFGVKNSMKITKESINII